MWTDSETDVDLLGFKVHADLIHSVVTDESLLPVVLGVFGDWGSGKSSIMKMLQKQLLAVPASEEDEGIVCLYFNGWMFEGYEDAKTALLTSILLELGEHQRFGPRVRDKVVKLLKRVQWMEVLKSGAKLASTYGPGIALTALSGGTVPAAAIPLISAIASSKAESESKSSEDKPKWSKLLKEDKEEPDVLEIRKFRDDFEKLLSETKIKSLVIIIDDLDRCLPERIIETLEAIKLFVLVPQTAFVIGADPRIVRHAIRTRYAKQKLGESGSETEELDDLAKDYLEKLIQIPYQLPRLSPAEIETYINLLSCQKSLTSEQNDCVLKDWKDKRAKNFYAPYQLASIREILKDVEIPALLDEQLSWSNSIADVVSEGLKGNPRQVKRMLNALLLRKKLAEVAGIGIKDEVLAKLMVLEYAHLARFLELNEWQSAESGKPSELGRLEAEADSSEVSVVKDERHKNWLSPSLLKWLQMKPSLQDIDLRDYYWLARDRTNSTLAGVEMVSPIVRRLYTALFDGNDGQRVEAIKECLALDQNEIDSLMGVLRQHVLRHPSEQKGFSILAEMADKGISSAVGEILSIIDSLKGSEIPAAVAPRLGSLKVSSPESAAAIDELFKKHQKDNTAFGRAAKEEI